MDTTLICNNTIQTTNLAVIEVLRPAIPTEVVENIIDAVARLVWRFHRQGIEMRTCSLHACSLVARSWVPRSRIHLFRFVQLCSDWRARRFLNSLTQSPALGQYVETIQIWPRNRDERTCGWIFKTLSSLPLLLPHLCELAFCDLPDLRPECIAVLSRFGTVESLLLFELTRQSLWEVVQLINRFPQLRRLQLLGCDWKLPGRYYSRKQHSLTTLMANTPREGHDRPFLEWVLASKSTGALTTFRIQSDVAGSAMERVLWAGRSTLRELHLDLWGKKGE